MEERKLTCIGCPMGCPLTVVMNGEEVVSVTGNTCKRGDVYARKEVTNPTRIVTSTVRVSGGSIDMVSVKTKEDIPKGKIDRNHFRNYRIQLLEVLKYSYITRLSNKSVFFIHIQL